MEKQGFQKKAEFDAIIMQINEKIDQSSFTLLKTE